MSAPKLPFRFLPGPAVPLCAHVGYRGQFPPFPKPDIAMAKGQRAVIPSHQSPLAHAPQGRQKSRFCREFCEFDLSRILRVLGTILYFDTSRCRGRALPEQHSDVWASGHAYEPCVGRWSRLVARDLLDWLRVPPGNAG